MVWSRGFLRLWIVLTLIWIGVIWFSTGAEEFKGLWSRPLPLSLSKLVERLPELDQHDVPSIAPR